MNFSKRKTSLLILIIILISIMLIFIFIDKDKYPKSLTPKISESQDLSESEILRNNYFAYYKNGDNIFFPSNNVDFAECLLRNPDMFKGFKIGLFVKTDSIINKENNSFSILAQIYDSYYDSVISQPIILSGNYQNFERHIISGDLIHVTGYFSCIETLETTNGSYQEYPLLTDCEIGYSIPEYSQTEIADIIKNIFGDNIDIKKENGEGGDYYSFNILNQTQNRIENWNFSAFTPYCTVSFNNDTSTYQVLFDTDYKEYVVINDNLNEINYYELNGKKLWSKKFNYLEKGMEDTIDIKNNRIYIYADDELHILNKKTGRELIEPVYLPNRDNLTIINDVILLTNNSELTDTFIAVDLNGDILWRKSMKNIPDNNPSNWTYYINWVFNENELLVEAEKYYHDDYNYYYYYEYEYQRINLNDGKSIVIFPSPPKQ